MVSTSLKFGENEFQNKSRYWLVGIFEFWKRSWTLQNDQHDMLSVVFQFWMRKGEDFYLKMVKVNLIATFGIAFLGSSNSTTLRHVLFLLSHNHICSLIFFEILHYLILFETYLVRLLPSRQLNYVFCHFRGFQMQKIKFSQPTI